MSKEVIYGVFDNLDAASYTIDELQKRGLERQISVIGPDLAELRPVTSKLIERRKFDPFFGIMVAGGAILGFFAGILGMFIPGIGSEGIGPLMAAISSAAAGSYLGLVAAAIAHFDIPQLRAELHDREIPSGSMMLAVHTDTEHHEQIEQLLDRGGAIEVDRRRLTAA